MSRTVAGDEVSEVAEGLDHIDLRHFRLWLLPEGDRKLSEYVEQRSNMSSI